MKKLFIAYFTVLGRFFEPFSTAWVGVATHKLRSGLTILGIVIGVGAVISLMSIGKGAESSIISRFQGMGTNLIFIRPGAVIQSGVRTATGTAETLTEDDAEAIADEVNHVSLSVPIYRHAEQVIAGNQNMRANITGITASYYQALNLKVAEGEPINDEHVRNAAKVTVIGVNIADTLFPGVSPLGQSMRIRNTMVRIIGVLETKGEARSGPIDDSILIPLTTMRQTLSFLRSHGGGKLVSSITVQVSDQQYIKNVMDETTSLLRYRHRLTTADNDFIISSQEDMLNALSQAMQSMTLLLGAIASISLLVGGIGVMNIMLVTVVERTPEIGIRKALGAQEAEIIVQFLIEAAFLTLSGGIIGILIGWGVSHTIASMGTYATLVSTDMVILAFTISVGIGLFFGLYPAWQASRLSPIEALRHE
jgi:putative ABC transport system permease protein